MTMVDIPETSAEQAKLDKQYEKLIKHLETDPLARIRAREGEMPALTGPEADNGSAEAEAAELLLTAMRSLQALDRDLAALNRRRARVFAEAEDRGLHKKILKGVYDRWRADPRILEIRDRLTANYFSVIRGSVGE